MMLVLGVGLLSFVWGCSRGLAQAIDADDNSTAGRYVVALAGASFAFLNLIKLGL